MFDLNIKILIVDDMLAMRKLAIKSCKELGFKNFTEAEDGVIAWQALMDATPRFDLIISEWDMPNAGGLDLLKRVRRDSRFNSIPFLMVSAGAESHQVTQAIQAGVSNYVIKPFTGEDLKAKLEGIHRKLLK